MTSYGKPRWPNPVLFGSYRDLNYRIDILKKPTETFRILTQSGPGFACSFIRDAGPDGFTAACKAPAEAQRAWLNDSITRGLLRAILEIHFSRLETTEESISLFCRPQDDDILPEGGQLTWVLSVLHQLWERTPSVNRKTMLKSKFIG